MTVNRVLASLAAAAVTVPCMSVPPAAPLGEATVPPRGSMVDHIASQTREAILSGRFALGQRLIEADLARDLGVSRGPLREALRRLSAEGLVDLVPNRGAVVRRLTRKEVADRYQIRESLEGLAARLAAGRLDEDGNRARLAAAWRPYEADAPPRSIDQARQDNYVLHQAIAEMSGNPQLAEMSRQLWLPTVMVALRAAVDAEHWRQSATEHARVVEAIRARRPAEAERAMRRHLRRGCETILALPAWVFGG